MKKPSIVIPYVNFDDCVDTNAITALLDAHGTSLIVDEVPWSTEYPYRPLVVATLAHDRKKLYASFIVRSRTVKGLYLSDQQAVCDDSCVEMFFRPEPAGEYWNFEFNCLGTLNASHRRSRKESTKLTPVEAATIVRRPSMPRESFEEREGTATWELTVEIPFELMGLTEAFPKVIYGNIYACASGMKEPYYLSYFPIDTPKPDYHRPEFFGPIVLE